MNEARSTRRALRRAIFLGLCLMILVTRLMPLGSSTGAWPAPDLMLCLVFAWMLRRPEDLPYWLLAPMLLLADLLLMRPPGLWSLLVLCSCEFLYQRQTRTRSLLFVGEMMLITVLFTALVVVHWAILSLLFVDQTGLGAQLRQVPVSVAAYPFVVLLLHGVLGVRKRPAPEGFGRRVSP